MAKRNNENQENEGKYVILAFVSLVLGFMLAFSYNTVNKMKRLKIIFQIHSC